MDPGETLDPVVRQLLEVIAKAARIAANNQRHLHASDGTETPPEAVPSYLRYGTRGRAGGRHR